MTELVYVSIIVKIIDNKGSKIKLSVYSKKWSTLTPEDGGSKYLSNQYRVW